MAGQQRYKTELFIPIKKDDQTFEERQKSLFDSIIQDSSFGGSRQQPMAERDIFSDMQRRMHRPFDIGEEIERMRRDFFRLKPSENRRGSSENLLERMAIDDIFQDDPSSRGQKRFQVGFDVSQFRPEEISVRVEDRKVLVNAKHEEKSAGKSMVSEFSRQVDIPPHVDASQLSCTVTQDGILQVEAPVPAPTYDKILDASPTYERSRSLTEQDGSQRLKMVVEVGRDYRPEEVLVKTVDRKLVISARHEERAPGRSSTKEFNREFDLPETVDPNTVTAVLNDEGKLVIEAPMTSYSRGQYTAPPGTKPPRIGVTIKKL